MKRSFSFLVLILEHAALFLRLQLRSERTLFCVCTPGMFAILLFSDLNEAGKTNNGLKVFVLAL